MASTATCPDVSELRKFALGHLPAPELEALVGHLEGCEPCLAILPTLSAKDTLVDVLAKAKTLAGESDHPALTRLIGELTQLRKAPLAAAVAEMRTVPPAPDPQLQTIPTTQSDAGDKAMPLALPASKPDGTLALKMAEPGYDASLIDFLAPPQAADELGRLGDYRILNVLGAGGMGVVFQAEDPKLKRQVALKAMLPALAASASASKRFVREAQSMAAVEHDHIVRVYQVGADRGVPYLAMEFLIGEPLDKRLQRDADLPLAVILRLGREMAEGLQAAHERGLIHRDIKPGNVWLEGKRARVKILDFGLARAATEEAHLTQQGAIIGTPAYMAPEQAAGQPVDQRCDLFSLGCVLYRMTTGQLPFHGTDTISTLMAVATEDPAAPHQRRPEIPPALSDLVMRLLEKTPADRPASAQSVVETLQAIEQETTQAVSAPQVQPRSKEAAVKVSRQKMQAGKPRRRWPLVLAGMCGIAAVLLATVFIIRLQNQEGEFIVEVEDDSVAVALDKQGGLKLIDKKSGKEYTIRARKNQMLPAGDYDLTINDAQAGLEFSAKSFAINSKDAARVRVSFKGKDGGVAQVKTPPADAKPAQPVDDAWLKAVAAMPSAKQVDAVSAKLKDLNPGFDGKVTPEVEGGVVTSLSFSTNKVTDISPVRALTGLRTLTCGAVFGKGQLADLSPLKGMKLTKLECYYTKVTDLLPLKDMPLTFLNCNYAKGVTDLSPLKGMKLTSLYCMNTKISDLSPLKGMPLTYLDCQETQVSELSPLKGMKLSSLSCGITKVSDLSPVKDMLLTYLDCGSTLVADLTPLKDMPLTQLNCSRTQVSELSPLKGMKLTTLNCQETSVFDLSPLKGMPLTFLNCNFTKVTDLSPLKDMKLTSLDCYYTKVTDLSPLKDMRLTFLSCGGTPVSDLSPLKDMRLTFLSCGGTPVSDLSPLKGMPLTQLNCSQTKVSDLSPLKGMPLTTLTCDFKVERDVEILRSIKTLQSINGKPATEFWKEVNAVVKSPVDDAWLKSVTVLPPAKQVLAVSAKLQDLNPGFDGKGTHKIVGDVVTELQLPSNAVTDLSPVRALTGLRTLKGGSYARNIADLSPLKDMQLTYLELGYSKVSDLSPLKGMKLTYLDLRYTTLLSDLSPLKDMPLTTLYCNHSKVTDLSPLKDMKLTYLHCGGTAMFDLSPLKGMPLTYLWCGESEVSDLSPLKDMNLTTLSCNRTKVSDLSPLKGMPLTSLDCKGTQVSDLSPLKGMPLKELVCEYHLERNVEILRSLPKLEKINGKPAAQFWEAIELAQAPFEEWLKKVAVLPTAKQVLAVSAKLKDLNPDFDGNVTPELQGGMVRSLSFSTYDVTDISPVRALTGLRTLKCSDASGKGGQFADLSPLKGMKLTSLECYYTRVTDLSPLKDMRLTFLSCGGTPVSDLSPLKGMPLTTLHCVKTNVSDLSPLTGMPLTTLDCKLTQVSDLSPLKGMPLTTLNCSQTKVSDLSPLKGMPLTTLNCDFKVERDVEILRSIKTLQTINGQTAAAFWKLVDKK